MIENLKIKIDNFCKLLENDLIKEAIKLKLDYTANIKGLKISYEIKRKYVNIDIGEGLQTSGKFMVDKETGIIYGIKGYGRVDKNNNFGTLDTTDQYFWGGYGISKLKEARELKKESLTSVKSYLAQLEEQDKKIEDTIEESISSNVVNLLSYKQNKEDSFFKELLNTKTLLEFENLTMQYLKKNKIEYCITNDKQGEKILNHLDKMCEDDLNKMFYCMELISYFPSKEDLKNVK